MIWLLISQRAFLVLFSPSTRYHIQLYWTTFSSQNLSCYFRIYVFSPSALKATFLPSRLLNEHLYIFHCVKTFMMTTMFCRKNWFLSPGFILSLWTSVRAPPTHNGTYVFSLRDQKFLEFRDQCLILLWSHTSSIDAGTQRVPKWCNLRNLCILPNQIKTGSQFPLANE